MPEAITKYAINSTLGTDDFKPLDQIIKGEKLFMASDYPIVVLVTNDTKAVGTEYITIGKFKPHVNGTIRLKLNIESLYGTGDDLFIQILKDNTVIHSSTYKIKNALSDLSLDINVVANSSYTFQIKRTYSSALVTLKNASINAQVTDYNYFEYETM